ncbi:hypothetical protein GCM10007890_55010 [Methylobacterium tardum]|uniref:Uncharacterized protein n=1 Tax=Methylobacterium tardum TaxID=374432 RepID=A0AA37TQ11_9HYPH|nr:hypothetical protein GCM10007890_55010 [Methylobacterium tardum]
MALESVLLRVLCVRGVLLVPVSAMFSLREPVIVRMRKCRCGPRFPQARRIHEMVSAAAHADVADCRRGAGVPLGRLSRAACHGGARESDPYRPREMRAHLG